jgi:hypothetical protein
MTTCCKLFIGWVAYKVYVTGDWFLKRHQLTYLLACKNWVHQQSIHV